MLRDDDAYFDDTRDGPSFADSCAMIALGQGELGSVPSSVTASLQDVLARKV